MTSTAAYLLIETSEGATVAVRFPDVNTARDWEDEHADELTVQGCATVVSRTEALRLSAVAASSGETS